MRYNDYKFIAEAFISEDIERILKVIDKLANEVSLALISSNLNEIKRINKMLAYAISDVESHNNIQNTEGIYWGFILAYRKILLKSKQELFDQLTFKDQIKKYKFLPEIMKILIEKEYVLLQELEKSIKKDLRELMEVFKCNDIKGLKIFKVRIFGKTIIIEITDRGKELYRRLINND